MIYKADLLFLSLVFFSLLSLGFQCDFDCRGRIEEALVSEKHIEEFTWPFWKKEEDTDPNVRFFLYNRERANDPEIYTVVNHKPHDVIFDTFQRNLTTKIIIHGWLAHVPSLITDTFKDAYLSVGDYNLIMVDWSKSGSMLIYPLAKSNIPLVANQVATFIDKLCLRYKIKPEDLHVIGHSLGAHISGISGRLIYAGRIGRITGLDPAGPLFDLTDENSILTRNAAEFVDVIHTCDRYLGISQPLGHVDFYPNGGHFIQIGCRLDLSGSCSHRRSYGYFTESIRNRQGFLGSRCTSWTAYKMGFCYSSPSSQMGEHVSRSARGSFFLKTNSMEPFAP